MLSLYVSAAGVEGMRVPNCCSDQSQGATRPGHRLRLLHQLLTWKLVKKRVLHTFVVIPPVLDEHLMYGNTLRLSVKRIVQMSQRIGLGDIWEII